MGKKIRRIIMAALLAVFLGSTAVILYVQRQYRISEELYSQASGQYTVSVQEEPDADQQTSAPIQVDFDALRAENADVVGWIYCEGTPIDYPVVQCADNDYYLHRSYDGSYSASGAIFTDANNRAGFVDCNTIIYGHHMKNGSMFRDIARFADPAYMDAHQDIRIWTKDQDIRLKPVYCYAGKADGTYRQALDTHGQVVQFIMDHTGMEINTDDLYVLVTCSYGSTDERTYLYCVPDEG